MRTPVALIIFNRPNTTAHVFAEIAKAKPSKLLVIADGPRPGRPGEEEKCAAARGVIERVDWECEVLKNYSDVNLGCGRRPATGISWVFEQVEEAIILEDDCVPHPSFFRFCEELLERYRDDERIMHIAGSNFLCGPAQTKFSYYFSCFNICWGWASWRRAWSYFDPKCKLWPQLKETSWLADLIKDERAVEHWAREFERAYHEEGYRNHVWDHQWTFAIWANSGLSILPRANLVNNIGCCPDATHTLDSRDPRAKFPTVEMEFPLKHPQNVLRCVEADRRVIQELIVPTMSPGVTRYRRMRQAVSRSLPAPIRQGLRWAMGRGRS